MADDDGDLQSVGAVGADDRPTGTEDRDRPILRQVHQCLHASLFPDRCRDSVRLERALILEGCNLNDGLLQGRRGFGHGAQPDAGCFDLNDTGIGPPVDQRAGSMDALWNRNVEALGEPEEGRRWRKQLHCFADAGQRGFAGGPPRGAARPHTEIQRKPATRGDKR